MDTMKGVLKRWAAVLWVCLFGILCACTCASAEEPYALGVAMGFTGTGAAYSRDGLDAVKLAVDEINAGGGFLGKHPIRVFSGDTETRGDVAAKVAAKLIAENKVRAIIGTYSSAAALAVKPVCRENKVLHIATISNSEDITRVDFSPFTFSVVPNTYMQSKAVALFVARLAKEKRWATYCTIASDYAWGRSSQELAVRFLKEMAPKLRLVGAFWPALGEKRFDRHVLAVRAYRPDCLIGFLAGEDNDAWLNEVRLHELIPFVPYPGSLISVTELMAHAKTLERGLIGLARAPFFAHMDVPRMADFVKRFRQKHNRYPSDWAVLSYDGVYALKQGMEKAGSMDPAETAAAMKGMKVDTCRGNLFFRAVDNQLSCSSYMGFVTDDPKYPFPIYGGLIELKGPDSWRPEAEILAARAK